MNELIQLRFDYSQLDLDTSSFVQARTNEIHALVKRSAHDIVEIGQKLTEVKGRLGHGNFGPWVEAEFGWSWDTANNFMRVADKFRNFQNLEGFAPSALYLLSRNDEARQEAVDLAESGEKITHFVAKKLVEQHKEKAAQLVQHIHEAGEQGLFRPLTAAGLIDAIDKDPEIINRFETVSPTLTNRILTGELTISQAKQEIARQRIPEPAITPPTPEGKYRCLVVDPPWPMKKIEREERPNQGVELDYPTMSLEEIEALPIPDLSDESGCHLYLWVTQKFLPAGLELVERWGFRYQCLMTWRKNVGFTPFSWMYDTEHVIFARRGNLPLQQLGLRLSFEAPVTDHSAKPDVFFDERVVLASPEPRLEMFARKDREGFTVYGNEV